MILSLILSLICPLQRLEGQSLISSLIVNDHLSKHSSSVWPQQDAPDPNRES